jgi:hypothetical protein
LGGILIRAIAYIEQQRTFPQRVLSPSSFNRPVFMLTNAVKNFLIVLTRYLFSAAPSQFPNPASAY